MRAIWSGEISFGLVTVPAKLYSATKDLTPSFTQLHRECGTKIQMVRRCPHCDREVAWEEIGKGYEVSKGHYALFTKEELAELEGDSGAGGIDIAEFVDPREIDVAFFDKSYWIGPAGKTSRGFELLRHTLESTGKVAVAKVKIRSRTRLGVLRPRGRLFGLEMMRFGDEMVGSEDIDMPDAKAPTDREMELAVGLVNQLSTHFDPQRHPDQYRTAVMAAVEQKVEANEVSNRTAEAEAPAAGGAQIIDLAEMLARSLGVAKPAAATSEPPAKMPESDKAAPVDQAKPGMKKAGTRTRGEKKRATGT